jgi:hypothetical protein
MLGPVDLEDWLDDEDDGLIARLRLCPEIQALGEDGSRAVYPGWSHFDFALALRFVATGYLDPHELHILAERVGL